MSAVTRLYDAVMDRVGTLPTTSLRIAMTLTLVAATGAVYLVLAVKVALFGLGTDVVRVPWEPSVEWLGFLAAMSGLDALQFFAKRKTHGIGELPPPSEPPAS